MGYSWETLALYRRYLIDFPPASFVRFLDVDDCRMVFVLPMLFDSWVEAFCDALIESCQAFYLFETVFSILSAFL